MSDSESVRGSERSENIFYVKLVLNDKVKDQWENEENIQELKREEKIREIYIEDKLEEKY